MNHNIRRFDTSRRLYYGNVYRRITATSFSNDRNRAIAMADEDITNLGDGNGPSRTNGIIGCRGGVGRAARRYDVVIRSSPYVEQSLFAVHDGRRGVARSQRTNLTLSTHGRNDDDDRDALEGTSPRSLSFVLQCLVE